MSATNDELEEMAKELYNELGAMRTKNGRIVRALLAKWKAAEANIDVMLAEKKMNNEFEVIHLRDCALYSGGYACTCGVLDKTE